MNWSGHGGAVNDLQTHPGNGDLFSSASEDRSLRLWSLSRGGCIAIFGGRGDGHSGDVLALDWEPHALGDDWEPRLASCGMDGRCKIWTMSETSGIGNPCFFACDYLRCPNEGPSLESWPIWSSTAELRLHTAFVDSIRWLKSKEQSGGNDEDERRAVFISKSTDSELVVWEAFPECYHLGRTIGRHQRVWQRLAYTGGSIWFVRLALDQAHERMAVSNDAGQVLLWRRRSDGLFEEDHGIAAEANLVPIRSLCFVSFKGAPLLLGGGQDGVLYLWDIANKS